MGAKPQRTSIMVLYTVVDMPHPTYNGMIGRTMLTTLSAIVSPIHLMIKFPTRNGIGCMRGDQKRARLIYHASTRSSNAKREAKSPTKAQTSQPEIQGGMISPIRISYPSEDENRVPRGYVTCRLDPNEDVPLNRFLRKTLHKGLKQEEEYNQGARRSQRTEMPTPSSSPKAPHRPSTSVGEPPRLRGANKGVSVYEPDHPIPHLKRYDSHLSNLN